MTCTSAAVRGRKRPCSGNTRAAARRKHEDYEAAVKADIQQSQQAIEPITGEKVNALSYPEGAYGTLTMDALRSQGIELTFTTQPGVNAVVQGLPQTLYSMHRITMTEDTNMDESLAELAK